MSLEQRCQRVGLQGTEVENDRRAGASNPVRKPPNALGRRGFIRAVSRDQENGPVVQVVREEDHEVERRDISPVQVLKHEHERCRGCPVGEKGKGVLEHSLLRAKGPPLDLPRVPERTQGLYERLVGQFRPDEVDRAPEEGLEPRGSGSPCQFGREPGLADARLSGDEGGRTASGARRIKCALKLHELWHASDENLTATSHDSNQYRLDHRQRAGRQMGTRTIEDT